MLATSRELPAFQDTMVDDTMEIASEHGQNMEQGDIDIDLDLTAGNVDEDYVLEDATSHIDFGNDFHPQPSPAVNDDIMLDDDNDSFQMEDADLLDEVEENVMEPESMSFATVDGLASHFGTSDHDPTRPVSEGANHNVSLSYEVNDTLNNENQQFGLQEEGSEDFLEHDDVEYPDEPHLELSEDVTKEIPVQGSQASSPSHHSATPTAPAEPRSPPTSVPELRLSSPNTDPNSDLKSPHADDSTTDSPPVTDASKLHGVKVVYREMDYDLFSSSELDDPDSYFLSDLSVAKKPLSEFFKAIREVIHTDLNDEDELCLIVESLGLETEEFSSSIEQVTLDEVLKLHAKLLQNDGLEPSDPCRMFLRTRSHFSRRFSNLTTAAADGKGLSEFSFWDDQSIGLNDSDDVDENKYDFEPNLESQVSGEEAPEFNGLKQELEDTEPNISSQQIALQEHEQTQSQDTQSKVESAEEHAAPPASDSTRVPSGENSGSSAPNLTKKEPVAASDVDEDGDLIDYSDDETEQHSGTQKLPLPNTDDNRTANEYEEADENLRRRSLSRAATEDRSLGEPSGETPAAANETELGQHPDLNEVEYEKFNDEGEKQELPEEHGVYEQFDEEGNGEYGEENEYQQFHEDYENREEDGEDGDSAAVVTEFDFENQEYDHDSEQVQGNGELAHEDLGHEYATEQGVNDENTITNFENVELEFEDGETSFPDDLNSRHDEFLLENSGSGEHDGSQVKSKANSLATVETTESSVTLGGDEIQYEDDLPEEVSNDLDQFEEPSPSKEGMVATTEVAEYKDEIDYEDDDEVERSQDLTASRDALPDAKGFSNVNGKRPIAEVESGDNQTSQINDAKRPRS